MLRKYYRYHGSGSTSTGEVPQQVRHLSKRDTTPHEGARAGTAPAPWYIYAQASWELQAGSWVYAQASCELGAAN